MQNSRMCMANVHSLAVTIRPGSRNNIIPHTSSQYEFSIPTDHPSGTYFYHPHGDGSHSVQVTKPYMGPDSVLVWYKGPSISKCAITHRTCHQIMGLMAGVFIVGDTTNEDDDDAYSAVDDQDVGEDTLVTTRTGSAPFAIMPRHVIFFQCDSS